MPRMDGVECTRQLRNKYGYKETPIIAMSANVQPSDKAECFNAGMNDFLAKPISITDLQRIISKYCDDKILDKNPDSVMGLEQCADVNENKLTQGFDLQGALERLGGSVQIYNRLAERYLQDIDEHKSRISNLFEDLPGDSDAMIEIRKILHLLQGSALTLGAVELAEFIRQVQSKVKTNQLDNKNQVLSQLNQKFSQTEDYLQQLLEEKVY